MLQYWVHLLRRHPASKCRVQLPAKAPGKAMEAGPSAGTPATHGETRMQLAAPSSGLVQPFDVNQQMEAVTLPFK